MIQLTIPQRRVLIILQNWMRANFKPQPKYICDMHKAHKFVSEILQRNAYTTEQADGIQYYMMLYASNNGLMEQ